MKKRFISLLLVFSIVLILIPVKGFAAPGDVSNFAEFKAALEDPNVIYINLTNSFSMGTNPVIINANKSSLVVNGNGFTISQIATVFSTYSIQLDTSRTNISSVTFQNMSITGAGQRGFMQIPSGAKNSAFSVNFDFINFNGQELIQAKYSDVTIANSNIVVQVGNDDNIKYLAEGLNITLGGLLKITKPNPVSYRTLFYINQQGSLTIAPGAHVDIQNNTLDARVSKKAGFAFFAASTTKLTFGENCWFYYEGINAFMYGYAVGDVVVKNGADVTILISGTIASSDGLLGVNSSMTILPYASFIIAAVNNTNAWPVIRFSHTATFTVDAPLYVLIYNRTQTPLMPSQYGLAISGPLTMTIHYDNVTEVGYYINNTAPYYALLTPTLSFTNDGGLFSTILSMSGGKVYTIYPLTYNGLTPLSSANLRDVNVISISGITET